MDYAINNQWMNIYGLHAEGVNEWMCILITYM